MKLQFCKSDIPRFAEKYWDYWTDRYPENAKREQKLIDMRDEVCGQNHLTIDILREVVMWISEPRLREYKGSQVLVNNSKNDVIKITGDALQSEDERVRWSELTRLRQVGPVVATAILHLFHKDPYPILSRRSAEAIGEGETYNYSFEFWQKYVKFCRNLARSANVEMRTLDRAFWWYANN